jgi:hypothetical protein
MKKKEKHNFALIVEKQSGETKMSEGELKKQLYECLQFGHEFTMEEVYKIVDEARKDFPCYACNLRCVFCGRECSEYKKWFLKWFGEQK